MNPRPDPTPGDAARPGFRPWPSIVPKSAIQGGAEFNTHRNPPKKAAAAADGDRSAVRADRIAHKKALQRKCLYMLDCGYSIVDMSVWGWASRLTYMLGDDRIMETYPNVDRLLREIDARPAAERARALATSHAFRAEFDETAMRALYPQIFAPDPD